MAKFIQQTARPQRTGLILLVVLGMLALFSLISVTFVVFTSQARSTSVALVKREVRGNKSRQPLLDASIMQLIRGTPTTRSNMFQHSLLEDLFGREESIATASWRTATVLQIRNFAFDPVTPTVVARQTPMTYEAANYQRPMLLGGQYTSTTPLNGRYLRIPLQPDNYNNPTNLPTAHDALTGRLVTFPESAGPLGGQTFRVIRYIGQMPAVPSGATLAQLVRFGSCYSIVIDLTEGDLQSSHRQLDTALGSFQDLSIAEWVDRFPAGAGHNIHQSGVYACYGTVLPSSSTPPRRLNNSYQLFMNAVPLNSHGVGVYNNGLSYADFSSYPAAGTAIHEVAAGLLPNLKDTGIPGDTDESYDAADYANFWLSHRYTNPTSSAQIIPSFHRAALVNYLVNFRDPATYTEEEFFALLERLEEACGRPLAINVRVGGAGGNTYVSNPDFSGSNYPNSFSSGGINYARTARLQLDIPQWTDWPQPVYQNQFAAWVRWLLIGPWDVDNDGDGIMDSVWMDLDLPLETSENGNLLKAMVAFYVEDLDNKLDINATGHYLHWDATNIAAPAATNPGFTSQANSTFAMYENLVTGQPFEPVFLPQGQGLGPAEISFRHLMAHTPGNVAVHNARYRNLVRNRYRGRYETLPAFPALSLAGDVDPGVTGLDAVGLLQARGRRALHSHNSLPGLPMSTHGRVAIALDRLGNPFMMNAVYPAAANMNQLLRNPYDSRWIEGGTMDYGYSIADWERIYRVGDGDRAALPDRLEQALGLSSATVSNNNFRHLITAKSSHLRYPSLATRTGQASSIPVNFIEMVNRIREINSLPAIDRNNTINWIGFASLFPLEMTQNQPMDLNRPFGNLIDDDSDGQVDEPREVLNRFASAEVNKQNRKPLNATSRVSIGKPVPNNPSPATTFVQFEDLQGQPFQVTLGGNQLKFFDPHFDYVARTADWNGLPFTGNETRQLFARHLYCLAQLILPAEYPLPNIDRATFNGLSNTRPANVGGIVQPSPREAERARVLAQWAVNVVDFRDADAAMTRFAYDPLPFEQKTINSTTFYGWLPPAAAPGASGERYVVWGMEQPELLMTETFAFHDLRVKRNQAPNARWDQYRIPEGSLFLELFCPRTTSTNGSSFAQGTSNLYDTTGAPVLDLSATAPPSAAAIAAANAAGQPFPEGAPIWRVYIGSPHEQGQPTPLDRYNDSASKHRFTGQVAVSNHDYTIGDDNQRREDALDSGLLLDRAPPTGVTDPQIPEPAPEQSRIVVFRSGFTPTVFNSPGVADPASQVFVSQSNVGLSGGQYLVAGPRDTTYFGSKESAWDPAGPVNRPNNHRIDFTGSWTQMFDVENNTIAQRGTMNNCVTVEVHGRRPNGWANNIRSPGLSVSEPLPSDAAYYNVPTTEINSNDNGNDPDNNAPGFANSPIDGYHDYSTPGNPPALQPFDEGPNGAPTVNSDPLEFWQLGQNTTTDTANTGTQQNFCTAYLQRLADPEFPWHTTLNPYITVDWMPIDLTVFSGEENHEDIYPEYQAGGNPNILFASRQKTGQQLARNGTTFQYQQTPALTGETFYSAATHAPRETQQYSASGGAGPALFFDFETPMDEVAGAAGSQVRPTDVDLVGNNHDALMTLGFLNSTYRIAGEDGTTLYAAGFNGSPAEPNEPLTGDEEHWVPAAPFWPNRQFVSEKELMMVPISAPGQFNQEFSGLNSGNVYQNMSAGINSTASPHLLNFFHESVDDSADARPNDRDLIPTSALFQFVETASPWADAYKHEDSRRVKQDPVLVGSGSNPLLQPHAQATNDNLVTVQAPYNRLSRYREPGRLNINTISEPDVFQGLLYNNLSPNRHMGGGTYVNERTTLASASATHSARGAFNTFNLSRQGFAPAAGFFGAGLPPLFNPNYPTRFAGVFKPEMEAGMVPATRGSVLDAAAIASPSNVGLLRSQPTQTVPLFSDPNNPYAYKSSWTLTHPISRQENLTTKRSNVFAVYVTVGFFEFNQVTGQLEREYRSDRGEAERYKAFYVVDRSVPVGFEVGEDHNTADTILVRRYLKDR